MKIIKIIILFLLLSSSVFARPYIDLGYGFTNNNPNSTGKSKGHNNLNFSSFSLAVGSLSGYLGQEASFQYSYKDSNNFFKHFSYSSIFALPSDNWEIYLTAGVGLLNIKYQQDINTNYKATIPLGLGFVYYFANRNSVGLNYKYYETFSDIKINTFTINYRYYFNLTNKNR